MTRNILCILLLSFGLNYSMFIDDSCAQVKTEIAVLGFTGNALNSSDLCISCLVHDELVKTGRFNMLERWAIEKVFEEAVYPWNECQELDCAIEIGKILAVQKIILGSLNNNDKILTLTLQLIDIKSGKIEHSFTADCKNCLKNHQLLKVIRKLCSDIADYKNGFKKE